MDGDTNRKDDDSGLFGRPLFQDPSARALSRVGVVDVGSNSVRLVVFDGAARSPAYFFNEKIMCALGEGLGDTGRLNPVGRERALAAMRRFARLAEGMAATPLTVVATAAMREAEDGPEFMAQVEAETGLKMWVVDGREEARLTAQGVLLGWPDAEGLVCDIGGSSMELAQLTGGRVGRRETSALGPLKLKNVKGGQKGLARYIATAIARLLDEVGTDHERLFLVGGSWRAIARLDMERRGYPLLVLHEYRISRREILETIKWIGENELEELRQRTGTSAARMNLVPIACLVLKQLVRTLKPSEICISSYGIREGLLYEQMPERLRRRDPLIEASRSVEAGAARIPGFGRQLYKFVLPLFPKADEARLRLIKAACLLHDTTWRAHPDYRHEVCFETATRANLGGLDHPGRVFLGLALLHRYKNSREGSRFEPLFSLLSEKDITQAEVLGKAMRFGSMFTMDSPEHMASMQFNAKRKRLDLTLDPVAEDLFGEVAQARFDALAKAMGATTRVKLRPAESFEHPQSD